MTIHVEEIPDYRVAVVRRIGPYGPDNKQAMEQLKHWAQEKNLLTESAILFGIAQDNPQTTSPEHCRYDACFVISETAQLEPPIYEGVIPGGKYLVYRLQHTAEEVQKAWATIIPYLQSNGVQIDDKPMLERYTGELISKEMCELCVPIK